MEFSTLVAGILTLAIFTFLYGDNPVYKMAESLLIGVSIGYLRTAGCHWSYRFCWGC